MGLARLPGQSIPVQAFFPRQQRYDTRFSGVDPPIKRPEPARLACLVSLAIRPLTEIQGFRRESPPQSPQLPHRQTLFLLPGSSPRPGRLHDALSGLFGIDHCSFLGPFSLSTCPVCLSLVLSSHRVQRALADDTWEHSLICAETKGGGLGQFVVGILGNFLLFAQA